MAILGTTLRNSAKNRNNIWHDNEKPCQYIFVIHTVPCQS